MARRRDASDTLPVASWYWNDWRGSGARARFLSAENFLAGWCYRELLDAHWMTADCSLPDDDVELAAMAGVALKSWLTVREEVVRHFKKTDNGRLRSMRAFLEWKRARKHRSMRRAKASLGGKAKRDKDKARINKDAPSVPEAGFEHASPSPSPSPITDTEALPPAAAASVLPPARPAAADLTDVRGALRSALTLRSKQSGRPELEQLHEHSRTPRGAVIRTLSALDKASPEWALATLSEVQKAISAHDERPAGTKPVDDTKAFWDRHPDAVDACLAFVVEHKNLEPAVAADLWLQDAGAPFHARIDVKRRAMDRVKPP